MASYRDLFENHLRAGLIEDCDDVALSLASSYPSLRTNRDENLKIRCGQNSLSLLAQE